MLSRKNTAGKIDVNYINRNEESNTQSNKKTTPVKDVGLGIPQKNLS